MDATGIILDHTCNKHEMFDPKCRACIWWKNHGKCSWRKHRVFDRDTLYKKLVTHYIEDEKMSPAQANHIAMKVVEQQNEYHKQKALQGQQTLT